MVKIPSSAIPANYLPKGWMVVTTRRRKGSTKGHQDKTYYNPSFQKFRSLRAVHAHIAATDPDPLPSGVTEATPVVVPETIVIDDNDGNDVIVIDSSSDDESDGDSGYEDNGE